MKVRGEEPQTVLQEKRLSTSVSSAAAAGPSMSSPRQHQSYTGKPAAEMRADAAEHRDRQPLVTLCAFCDWRFDGLAGEAREAARAHRVESHPEAAVRKPRRTRRLSKRALRSVEEEAQAAVDAAELNRVRAEREDAERLAKVLRARAREAA